jgi:hypothetical protein
LATEGLPELLVELLNRLDPVCRSEAREGQFDARAETARDERRTQMTDFDDVGRKATQKARETAEKTSEETLRAVEQSYSAAFDNIRNLNVKLIDAAQANAEVVCALARNVATIKTPSDLLPIWTNHAQKQFDVATKLANDLAALGQKLAIESTAPMIHGFQQAFTQGTT